MANRNHAKPPKSGKRKLISKPCNNCGQKFMAPHVWRMPLVNCLGQQEEGYWARKDFSCPRCHKNTRHIDPVSAKCM